MKRITTPIVDKVGQYELTGNIVPVQWLKSLRTVKKTKHGETSSPHMIAAYILSDIWYWYKPTYVRDEATGEVVLIKKKFKADKLQKSKNAIAEFLGVTSEQVREALHFLRDKELITIEYRTIGEGKNTLNNVMFIEPIVSNILKITYQDSPESEVEEGVHCTPHGQLTPTPHGQLTPTPHGQLTSTPHGQLTSTNTKNTLTKNNQHQVKQSLKKAELSAEASSAASPKPSAQRIKLTDKTIKQLNTAIFDMYFQNQDLESEIMDALKSHGLQCNSSVLKIVIDYWVLDWLDKTRKIKQPTLCQLHNDIMVFLGKNHGKIKESLKLKFPSPAPSSPPKREREKF